MTVSDQPLEDQDALIGTIIKIWADVLDVSGIEPDSHLLDLGATSLSAVKIRSRIRVELGRDVDLVEFLEHPTPREFAPIVRDAERWEAPEPWQQMDWSDDA